MCDISKRDYFAGQAIGTWTTLIAQRGLSRDILNDIGLTENSTNAEGTARLCYMIADAMIKEGSK